MAKALQGSDSKSMTVEQLSEICYDALCSVGDGVKKTKELNKERFFILSLVQDVEPTTWRLTWTEYGGAMNDKAKCDRCGDALTNKDRDNTDRWRDTYITNKLRDQIDIVTVATWAGHERALKGTNFSLFTGVTYLLGHHN